MNKTEINVELKLEASIEEIKKALEFKGFVDENDIFSEDIADKSVYTFEDMTTVASGKEEGNQNVDLKYSSLEHGNFFELYLEKFNDSFDIEEEDIIKMCETGILNLEFDDCIYIIKVS